ncbi:MAG: hypothetical protein ACRDHN_18670, partial [Thermomicrobiales bacterium]
PFGLSRAATSPNTYCDADPTVVGCPGYVVLGTVSPDEQLVQAFSPIVMLKEQTRPCDSDGEAFLPAPVEVVFDDPEVNLVFSPGRGRSEEVANAPNLSDLDDEQVGYHLDFPGNPRRPGCGYEQWFKARMEGHTPTAYANIAFGDDGRMALQYWFFYVFNDFNNTHEGDWERIQLIFEATSVEEALTEQPVEVGYSQHAGGERSDWNDSKLSKKGIHPVIFAASGSHASKFGSGTYIGWGEDASGFGCDITTGPSVRVVPEVILLPNDISQATGSLAWLTWPGRWGERQPAFYNGPEGPGIRQVWTEPFTWQDTRLRDSSIQLPMANTFGPGPTNVFCDITALGSLALTRVVVYPWTIAGIIGAMIAICVILARIGGPILSASWRMYRAHFHVFAPLGLMLIPIGLIAGALQFLFIDYPPGRQILNLFDRGPGARLALVLTVGGLQQLINLLVIGPTVIEAVAEIRAGRKPSLIEIYRDVFRKLRALLLGGGKSLGTVALLAISVVGIPFAIARAVRWLFVSQVVLIESVDWREAQAMSSRTVFGHWRRTAGTSVLLAIVGTAVAPALGIAFLVIFSPGIRYVNWFSSLLFAVTVPLSVIGMTLLYFELRQNRPQVEPVASLEPYDPPADVSPAPGD